MKQKLYVHIGPHKTGTTAIQEFFYHNRMSYIKEGLVYPKSGIVGKNWGHRHLRLARSFKPDVWQAFVREVEESGSEKILISAERFSADLSHLIQAKEIIQRFDPILMIVLRDEVAWMRSMYLQAVKSYFTTQGKNIDNLVSFDRWWSVSKDRFVYGRMVSQWEKNFGEDKIVFLKYVNEPNRDIINEVCEVLNVPMLSPTRKYNKSICPISARLSMIFGRIGWVPGRAVMNISERASYSIPSLRNIPIKGFDEGSIEQFYRAKNENALSEYPRFRESYLELKDSTLNFK